MTGLGKLSIKIGCSRIDYLHHNLINPNVNCKKKYVVIFKGVGGRMMRSIIINS